MIICHSRKFVFFSFPKTGSESLRDMLSDLNEETVTSYSKATVASPWYSHMSPAEAKTAFAARGLNLGDYFTFTVTRNPYPRMVSIYEMVMAVDRSQRLWRGIGLPAKPFGKWLAGTQPGGAGGGGRNHDRWRKFGTWSTQNWISGHEGRPIVDKVLKLEHLSGDLPAVLKLLDVPVPETLVHKNRRVSSDWRSYYNTATRALVADRFAWDLDTYGYGFQN
jgi:hypothetical protein